MVAFMTKKNWKTFKMLNFSVACVNFTSHIFRQKINSSGILNYFTKINFPSKYENNSMRSSNYASIFILCNDKFLTTLGSNFFLHLSHHFFVEILQKFCHKSLTRLFIYRVYVDVVFIRIYFRLMSWTVFNIIIKAMI